MTSVTPPTPFYLVVGAALCVVALTLASLQAAAGYKWVEETVRFGQSAGGILFTGIALSYFIWEGSAMLAERYKREQYAKGRSEGRSEAIEEAIEADRQRKPGETLEQAMERITGEKSQRR